MHDCLQLRNIRRIKDKSMRELAEAVAERHFQSVMRLFVILAKVPNTKNVLLLPALFVNLDKNLIPDPSVLDDAVESEARNSAIDDISRAMHSLTSVNFLMLSSLVPAEAAPDLWPHIWLWLNFFHTYWDALPIIKNPPQQPMAAFMHCSILRSLLVHTPTGKVIRSTPGVHRLLATAWKAILHNQALFPKSLGILMTIMAVLVDDSDDDANFEEIIEGVGGSIHDLASLVLKHYDCVCSLPRSSDMEILASFSGGLFMFGCGAKARLDTLLRSMGAVQRVVAVIRIFLGTAKRPRDLIHASMIWVFHNLKEAPGYPNVALALKAGLLEVIVTIATSRLLREDHLVPIQDMDDSLPLIDIIMELLTEVLPRATVHYTVVAQLKTTLPEAVKLTSTWKFRKSQFAQEFQTFAKLASERVEAYDLWVRGGPSLKACDNLTCGKIEERSAFRCCARCRSSNYCSEDCQTSDWLREHKRVCEDLQIARLHSRDTLTAGGRSFLRTLLTRDYLTYQASICVEQIIKKYRRPDEDLFTIFAYVGAEGVGIDYASTSDAQFQEEKWTPMLRREVARAARSGGRMEVHLAYIFEGDELFPLLFPMRTPAWASHDGVQKALHQFLESEAKGDGLKDELGPLIQEQMEIGRAGIH